MPAWEFLGFSVHTCSVCSRTWFSVEGLLPSVSGLRVGRFVPSLPLLALPLSKGWPGRASSASRVYLLAWCACVSHARCLPRRVAAQLVCFSAGWCVPAEPRSQSEQSEERGLRERVSFKLCATLCGGWAGGQARLGLAGPGAQPGRGAQAGGGVGRLRGVAPRLAFTFPHLCHVNSLFKTIF